MPRSFTTARNDDFYGFFVCFTRYKLMTSFKFYANRNGTLRNPLFLGRFSQGCVEIFRQAKTQKSVTLSVHCRFAG